jgi:membrane fusion protein, multidrug efflux system
MNDQAEICKMKTEKKYLTGTVLVAAMLILAACGQKGGQQAPGGGPGGGMPPPEVNVLTVGKGAATLTEDLPGRVEAYRTAQVRARVDGIVEKRLFVEGSDVKEGDTLYRIDARNYQTAYDAAKADADVARRTAERYKSLLESKAASQQDYDLAEAKFKQAEAALSKAQLDLENTSVPAPIAGRIGRALVTEGALVGHGDATLLATIEQLDPIYVNFTRPSADVMRMQRAVKAGRLKHVATAKVELVLDDGSLYAHSGKLLFSDLAIDPDTGSISLRARFPNPQYELLPGMYVQVRFSSAGADDVIRVPQRAVMTEPQGQFVMTVDAEGKAAPRPIKTGGMSEADFVVTEGLHPGDQVIVDGLQKARPGTPVKPVPLGAAPAAAAAKK